MNSLDVDTLSAWSFPLRFAVIVGICALLGCFGYFFVLQDQRQQIHQAQQTQIQLRETFAEHQANVARLPAYRAQQSALQTELDLVLAPSPSDMAMADVLVDISQTGLIAGVTFDLFQPQSVIQHPLYAEFPVQVRIIGRYHALGAFISGLANRPRLMTLQDINLRPHLVATQPNSKTQLILEATIRAYQGMSTTP